MKEVNEMTHTQALNEFFGGTKKMADSALPWNCKCGFPCFSMASVWNHIDKGHNIRLLKLRK